MYAKYRDAPTKNGFTFDQAIQTGVDNPGHPFIMTVGCVAGDEESYVDFADMFDPVIEARHSGFKKTDKHKTDMNPNNLKGGTNMDPKYVLSSRVRTGRSIRGLCLPPHCSRAERRAVEKISCEALANLTGDLKGAYHPLENISFSTNPFRPCCSHPEWLVIGPTHVESGTTTPRTSWSGSMKKIISVLSPWKRVVTSVESSTVGAEVSMRSRNL